MKPMCSLSCNVPVPYVKFGRPEDSIAAQNKNLSQIWTAIDRVFIVWRAVAALQEILYCASFLAGRTKHAHITSLA